MCPVIRGLCQHKMNLIPLLPICLLFKRWRYEAGNKAPSRSQFSTGHYACNNTRSVKVEKPQTNFDILCWPLYWCPAPVGFPSLPFLT